MFSKHLTRVTRAQIACVAHGWHESGDLFKSIVHIIRYLFKVDLFDTKVQYYVLLYYLE